MSEHELFALLRQIRMDATAIQAKVTDALKLAAAANIPQREPEFMCLCGVGFHSARALALHGQNVHDGPAVPMSEVEVKA